MNCAKKKFQQELSNLTYEKIIAGTNSQRKEELNKEINRIREEYAISLLLQNNDFEIEMKGKK